MAEPEDKFIEIYQADRRLYLEMSRDAMKSFDTNIVAIAAGGLTLSITFLHEIAPHPRLAWLLALAWLSWVACLVVVLLSYLNHEKSLDHQVKVLDDYYLMKCNAEPRMTEQERRTNSAQTRERQLNVASLGCLVLGIIFFATFSVVNLPNEEEKAMAKVIKIDNTSERPGSPWPAGDVHVTQKSATTPPVNPALAPQPPAAPAQGSGSQPESGSSSSSTPSAGAGTQQGK